MRLITLDCEFVPNIFDPGGLISIGMTDGENDLYVINPLADLFAARAWEPAWMPENVLRHLPLRPDGELDTTHPDVAANYDTDLCEQVDQFFTMGGHHRNQRIHMNCGAQDMVRIHGLWGYRFEDLPPYVPKRFRDMGDVFDAHGVNEDDLPQIDPARAHHALWDAQHDYTLLRHLGEAV